MKKIIFITLVMAVSSVVWASPPDEDMIKSCLLFNPVNSSIIMKDIKQKTIYQEHDYIGCFSTPYMFKYRGADFGLAENKTQNALIYHGKLYLLSKSIQISLGKDQGKPYVFDPFSAFWYLERSKHQQYFCISFSFDGLGESGHFQNVRGGYLLDEKTKILYYVVRYYPGNF